MIKICLRNYLDSFTWKYVVVPEVQSDPEASEPTRHQSRRRPPLMQVMKCMVPSVLALATLKYQGNAKSPFVENPIPVWCFLAATCVYWMTIGAMEQMPPIITTERYNMILSRVALSSGALSAKSLFLIFIPSPLSFWLLAIWIPSLFLLLACPVIKSLYNNNNLLGAGIFMNAIHKICTKLGWVRGYEEEESLPPV